MYRYKFGYHQVRNHLYDSHQYTNFFLQETGVEQHTSIIVGRNKVGIIAGIIESNSLKSCSFPFTVRLVTGEEVQFLWLCAFVFPGESCGDKILESKFAVLQCEIGHGNWSVYLSYHVRVLCALDDDLEEMCLPTVFQGEQERIGHARLALLGNRE